MQERSAGAAVVAGSADSDAADSRLHYRDAYEVVRGLLSALGDDTASAPLEPMHGLPDALWCALAQEAEHHGVTPLIAPAIAAAHQGTVPEDVRRIFVALALRHRRAAAARERALDRLLQAFAAAGLPVILLKGAALAHLIYPAPALRAMADVDVLIEGSDTARALAVVRDLGFAFAPRHDTPFAGRMHHLPPATTTESGFRITLEIHRDALSPNQPQRLTYAMVAANARPLSRAAGPPGLALGHTDMLRHLSRHAFEPARRVRLVHLYDLWRYAAVLRDEIDWRDLAARFPDVPVALGLAAQVLAPRCGEGNAAAPAGAGCGMLPLSEIASERGLRRKLAVLFDPPAWWLHGYYGVPPGRSLLACRVVHHPATVVRWLARRLAAGALASLTGPIGTGDEKETGP
jgi:hypothetical protein